MRRGGGKWCGGGGSGGGGEVGIGGLVDLVSELRWGRGEMLGGMEGLLFNLVRM